MSQEIIFTNKIAHDIDTFFDGHNYDKLFILADENTARLCFPIIANGTTFNKAIPITIKPGDIDKSIEATTHVWQMLSENGATRNSCLINIGGGMVTDLGGFAASTFKRGIDFVNIPTTLLAQVDASAGGKTGINFNGLKNEIGVFNEAKMVFIDTYFLKSLDRENLYSGYAEMIKHSLISNKKMWAQHITLNFESHNHEIFRKMIEESIKVKEYIVNKDPKETGIRKALNFGHTAGHAFESLAMKKRKPILHGYAVAYGIICELYLSVAILEFPIEKLRQTACFIRDHYGRMDITCDDYNEMIRFMTHDKKNSNGFINFTLLKDIGIIRINQTAEEELIKEAFDFYRES